MGHYLLATSRQGILRLFGGCVRSAVMNGKLALVTERKAPVAHAAVDVFPKVA